MSRMDGEKFVELIRVLFTEAAVVLSEGGEPCLHEPGLAGLNIMLSHAAGDAKDVLVREDVLGTANLMELFEEFGWTQDKNIFWVDMEKLVESLQASADDAVDSRSAQDGETGLEDLDSRSAQEPEFVVAGGLASLMEEIAKREEAKEFPLLLPEQCEGKGGEYGNAAEETLSLLEKIDTVQMQSYIDRQRELYFMNSKFEDGRSPAEAKALWAYRYYYKHMRDYLAVESLAHGKFAHRFNDDAFLAMIPPQTLEDPVLAREAFDTVARLKRQDVGALDKALWDEWSGLSDVLEESGGDKSVAFVCLWKN